MPKGIKDWLPATPGEWVALGGIGFMVYGLWLVWAPLGFLALGGFLLSYGMFEGGPR